MKKLSTSLIAASILITSTVSAGDLMINTGADAYDVAPSLMDAGSTTGIFESLGFGGLSATSIYELSGGAGSALTGKVIDTNISTVLASYGIPVGPTLARDGTTSVSIEDPGCSTTASNAKCDFDELQPLVPPFLGNDGEGFLLSWDLQIEYFLEATLGASGPVYDGGYFEVFFNDFASGVERKVLRAEVQGSLISPANLDIFFKITEAEVGFISVDVGGGSFKDVGTQIGLGFEPDFQIHTNVFPPIPTDSQLVEVASGLGLNAIRQTNLNGFGTISIPEPASIAILGLGLLGLGAASRRKK